MMVIPESMDVLANILFSNVLTSSLHRRFREYFSKLCRVRTVLTSILR